MRKTNISTEWYHRCKGRDEEQTRKNLVESSTPILAVLKSLVDQRKLELLSTRETDYDVPGWPYLQAHRNGRLEELDRLSNLLGSATDQNG